MIIIIGSLLTELLKNSGGNVQKLTNIILVINTIRVQPTFVSVFNESLIDVLLLSVFQHVEETQVDSVRLFHDDVQQRLSGFDWKISQSAILNEVK